VDLDAAGAQIDGMKGVVLAERERPEPGLRQTET
jgi:hypothetical protein